MSRLFRAPNRRLADLWSQKANYFSELIPMVYYRRKRSDRVFRPNRTRKLPPGARNGHHLSKRFGNLGVARVVRFGRHPVGFRFQTTGSSSQTGGRNGNQIERFPGPKPTREAEPVCRAGREAHRAVTGQQIQRFPNCELGAA